MLLSGINEISTLGRYHVLGEERSGVLGEESPERLR